MNSRDSLVRAVGVALVVTLAVVGLAVAVDLASDKTSTSAPPTPTPTPSPTSSPPTQAPASGEASVEQARLRALARVAERKAPSLRKQARASTLAPTPFSVNLAVFNILGSNHTSPGSDADEFASGRIRADWAADVVRTRSLEVVGFSELQGEQLDAFLRNMGGSYAMWPGRALGNSGIQASVAWSTSRFTAVDKDSFTIPFVGQTRKMPVVRLKESGTGRQFYVINVHNAPEDRQAERDAAMRTEIAVVKELRKTGLPVFFIGDLNEKENALCKITAQTDLQAAGPSGNIDGCDPWRGMRLDWIFGARATFTGYVQDRSPLVRRVTDHAVVVARAKVT